MIVRKTTKRSAFTLIEVLLVMALLAMIATGGIVGIQKARAKANIKQAATVVGQVKSAVKMYNMDMNEWPADDAGLNALVERPTDEDAADNWAGPYIEGAKVPKDPWGMELNFKLVDDSEAEETGIYFHVYSSGPNKIDDSGTGDDIPAWAESK